MKRIAATVVGTVVGLVALSASTSMSAAAAVADPNAPNPGGQAEARDDERPPAWSDTAANAADRGAFLPLTLSPTVGASAAVVTTFAGYDGARDASLGETAAEVRVWGPFALRIGAVYSDAQSRLRPSIGGRWQFTAQERSGIDGAVGVFYRPEGLTEPEGEIETVVSIGRRVGALNLIGNLAYGQDPEGRERDGEVRLAAFTRFARRFQGGVDGRVRFDLGSDRAKLTAAREPTFDLVAGPIAGVRLGPIQLTAQAGLAAVRFAGAGTTATGAIAMAGAGTAF